MRPLPWLGITYPRLLDHGWIQRLWAKYLCPRGWHLWDEVLGACGHSLYCDACEISIAIGKEDCE